MLVERGNSRTDRPIPTIRQWGKPGTVRTFPHPHTFRTSSIATRRSTIAGYEIQGRVTMDQNEPVVARLETMEACVLVVSHFASGH
jgi:hypothetical protein